MPIPPKTLSRVFHSAPARAALAVGGAALSCGALLAFPPSASAASNSANLIIHPTHTHIPFPTLSFPVPPTTGFPTAGNSTIVPAGSKKSPGPTQSDQGQFSYVSTFSPSPVASSAPANTASANCLANGQPVTGPGGDLDLPGINGTSKDAGHAGALPINSLGPTAMLPPQIDSANLGQLKVTRPVDATSTNLSMVASSGYRFPCVHIEIGAGQGFANAEYALANAGLVADDRSGSTETLTWTYSTILWSYTLPGSADVHQGSGQINAQPDRTKTSLVTDSKLVAAGTIGLTVVVSLGLLALYIIGRRRHKARYRARYYRRAAAMRAQREATATVAVSPLQPLEPSVPVEPAEVWEPQLNEAVEVEAAAEVAAEAAEPVEVVEAATETATGAEATNEAAESAEIVEETEAIEAAEPMEAAEPVELAEPVEAVDQEQPEAEDEAEADGTESDEAEAEAEAEPAQSAPEEQVEEVEDVEETSEPVAEATEPEASTEPEEPKAEPEEPTEPAESVEPEPAEPEPAEPEESGEPEPAEPEESAEPDEPTDSAELEPEQEPETDPAPDDKHEPAAAR